MKRLSILFTALTSCIWICAPQAHGYQSGRFPDFDEDGVVGFADFLQFAGRFGTQQGDEAYDDSFELDGDGAIGFSDFLILASVFGEAVPRSVRMNIDFPLRAISASGNWGDTGFFADRWIAGGGVGALIPLDYIDWLKSLHVNWVGLVVTLHYDDSMDSTVERVYSPDVDISTFSDEALSQLIREFRIHGFDVYLTLAFAGYEAEIAARPVQRWQLGDPAPPHTGGVPPDDPNVFGTDTAGKLALAARPSGPPSFCRRILGNIYPTGSTLRRDRRVGGGASVWTGHGDGQALSNPSGRIHDQ